MADYQSSSSLYNSGRAVHPGEHMPATSATAAFVDRGAIDMKRSHSAQMGGLSEPHGSGRMEPRPLVRRGDFVYYAHELDELETRISESSGGSAGFVPSSSRGSVSAEGQQQALSSGSSLSRERIRQPMLLEPLGNETMVVAEEPPDGGGDVRAPPPEYISMNVFGVEFELPPWYSPPVDALGYGGYGFVISAVDGTNGEKVAVKKISHPFRDAMDAKRVLREIVIQRHMEHPNIAGIRDVIRPPNPLLFKDVYIVYDLMPTDLHEVISSNQALTEKHYKYILVQLLRGLKFIHSANVLHRDLKPQNILIDERCNVRITDFGLARTVLGLEDHMTEYVVTRWYRAPEVLLNVQKHTGAIDMWSLGCIYMELITRKVWIRGRDPMDQLKKTLEKVGSPSDEDLDFLESADAKRYVQLMNPSPRRPFLEQYPTLTPRGAHLAEQMLTFNPEKRITVDEALAHPYLAGFNDPQANITCEAPFVYDLSFEQPHFTVALIRQLIYEVACDFNPDNH